MSGAVFYPVVASGVVLPDQLSASLLLAPVLGTALAFLTAWVFRQRLGWIYLLTAVIALGLLVGLNHLLGVEPKPPGAVIYLIELIVGTVVVSWALLGVEHWLARRTTGNQLQRHQYLIIVATSLFLTTALGRFLQSDQRFAIPGLKGVDGYSTMLVLLPLALAALPGWIIYRFRNFWVALATLFVYSLAAIFMYFQWAATVAANRIEETIATLAVYLCSFVFGICLLRWPRLSRMMASRSANRPARGKAGDEENSASNNEAATPEVDPATATKTVVPPPSIWGWLAGAGTLFVVLTSFVLDPVTLLVWQGSQRMEVAMAIRELQTSRNSATKAGTLLIGFSPFPGRAVRLESEFQENTAADYFSSLPDLGKGGLQLTIQDMQAHIETSPLRDCNKMSFVTGGEITPDQFLDLFVKSSNWNSINRLDVLDEPFERTTEPIEFGSIYIQEINSGLVYLLNTIRENDKIELFIYDFEEHLTPQDFQAICQVAEHHRVEFFSGKPISVECLEIAKKSNPANLYIGIQNLSSKPAYFEDPKTWEAILQTTMQIRVPGYERVAPETERAHGGEVAYEQYLWDAYFGAAGGIWITAQAPEAAAQASLMRQSLVDKNYVFDSNPDPDNIRYLYFGQYPFAEFGARQLGSWQKLSELEVLSFDQNWMRPTKNADFRLPQTNWHDVSNLMLPKLRELYLPPGVVTSASIPTPGGPKAFPELRHIQFDALDSVGIRFRASAMPKLESATIFTQPPPIVIRELNKLKNLKKVTLIDQFMEMADETVRNRLRRLVRKDIQLEFILAGEPVPGPPKSFVEHRERLRQKLIQKYIIRDDSGD